MSDLLLTSAEIYELTGLELPRCQVRRLQEQGFARARLVRGKTVLERAHYEAVCRGMFAPAPAASDTSRPRPALRSIK
jgi:hypothetical protein